MLKLRNNNLGIKKVLFLCCFILLSISTSQNVQAATSYFNPASGSIAVGSVLTVSVLVNTENAAINNAEATISFPNDLLEVISVNKVGSIFSLWVEDPSFSNLTGTVSFNGGLPTPGFNGAGGKILSVSFRAKKEGSASLAFSSMAIRANDGYGTNVSRVVGSTSYNLVKGSAITPGVEESPIVVLNAPKAPHISSLTHPIQDRWYSNNSPELSWDISTGITETRLLVDENSFTVPTILYPEPIFNKKLNNLADGIWYFHVQLKNKFGWGSVANFKIQIDTTSPQPFEIKIKEGEETTTPQPTLVFKAIDKLSGIDYYELKIDQENPIKINGPEYRLPAQGKGKHLVALRAVDMAGNYAIATQEFNTIPIEAPIITEYTKSASPGAMFSIKGTSLPEVAVIIHVQKNGKETMLQEVKSDQDGIWSFIGDSPTELGAWEIWAEVKDSSGAKSDASGKVFLKINPPIFIKIGRLAIDYLSIIFTLLGLISFVIFGAYKMWKKIQIIKKQGERRLKEEITEAEKSLYNAFRFLEKETKEQIAQLDGRASLSTKEKDIYNNLKKALENSEKFVGKEIEDVKKRIAKEEKEKGIRKEFTEVEKSLYDAFRSLEEEVKEQVAKLDGRSGLSAKEENICTNLKKILETSEKFVGKEVEDIKKELDNRQELS
ncbi:MAG: hypothetical protein NTV62_02545 [Candidatus Gribaldobacteria bacterium]|nr:hypothetical protein [Candidatus Gribaldobacteria bacterium]